MRNPTRASRILLSTVLMGANPARRIRAARVGFRTPLLLAALAAAAQAALADEIILKNGRSLEGQVTEAGDSVVFERAGIRMEIRRDEVQEIRKTPTPREEYARRAAGVEKAEKAAKPDAEARHRLGLWCATKGLRDEARAEQEKAIALDPDHEGARRALGFLRVEGRWRPEEEVMRERGLVRAGDRWMTPEEAAEIGAAGPVSPRERERREARERGRRMRKALDAALRRVASPDPATRAEGEKAVVAVAREMNEPDLEARAPELRAYYDRLYEEIASARALLQIKAQVVTLKRPIPKFTTSLGAFSSPVTLQLPELSVISINTTVSVPLGLGDDE